jgi:hypothetical protein
MILGRGVWVAAGIISATSRIGRRAKRLLPGLVPCVQQRQALTARHRGVVVRGDPFHRGPVGGLPVPGVTQDHAILIEGVQFPLRSPVPGHEPHPERGPLGESYRPLAFFFGTVSAVRSADCFAARFAGFRAGFPAPIAFGRACRGW